MTAEEAAKADFGVRGTLCGEDLSFCSRVRRSHFTLRPHLPLFSLGAPISQPSAGLRFRVFRSMKPLPLPAIRAERRSDGAKLIRNRDYWLFHQTAGLWSGDGGSVQIGVVLYPPIAKSEFKTDRELSAEFQSPEQPLSAEQLKTWIRDFTQAA